MTIITEAVTDPEAVDKAVAVVTSLSIIAAKYAFYGKATEGLIGALKRWFRLDEKLTEAGRDYVYPALALVVMTGLAFTVPFLLDMQMYWKETVLGIGVTWGALVGVIYERNKLADRSSGKIPPSGKE